MEIRNRQADIWLRVSGVAEHYVETVGNNTDQKERSNCCNYMKHYVTIEFYIFLILEIRTAVFLETALKVCLNIHFILRPICILFSGTISNLH